MKKAILAVTLMSLLVACGTKETETAVAVDSTSVAVDTMVVDSVKTVDTTYTVVAN